MRIALREIARLREPAAVLGHDRHAGRKLGRVELRQLRIGNHLGVRQQSLHVIAHHAFGRELLLSHHLVESGDSATVWHTDACTHRRRDVLCGEVRLHGAVGLVRYARNIGRLQVVLRDDGESSLNGRVARQDRGEILEAVLQDLPLGTKAPGQRSRIGLERECIEIALLVLEHGRRGRPADRGKARREHAVERGLAGVQAFCEIAGGEERVQPCRLGACETECGARPRSIEAERRGARRGGTERPVGRCRMPEPVVGRHHRHADADRHLISGHDGSYERAPGEILRLGKGQGRRHDNGTCVQQRALVRIVEVGSVDERPVRERRQGRIRLDAGRAPDRGRRGRPKGGDQPGHDGRLLRIVAPRPDGASESVENDVAGLPHDRLGQVLELQPGNESAKQCRRAVGFTLLLARLDHWRPQLLCHRRSRIISGRAPQRTCRL